MRVYEPRTAKETALVDATLAVYAELVAAGRKPADAWQRIDGLTDAAVVEVVLADEAAARAATENDPTDNPRHTDPKEH